MGSGDTPQGYLLSIPSTETTAPRITPERIIAAVGSHSSPDANRVLIDCGLAMLANRPNADKSNVGFRDVRLEIFRRPSRGWVGSIE